MAMSLPWMRNCLGPLDQIAPLVCLGPCRRGAYQDSRLNRVETWRSRRNGWFRVRQIENIVAARSSEGGLSLARKRFVSRPRPINRGHIMSKITFLEGLDLLRQDFSVENAKRFVSVVLEQMPYHPKELLYIVEWLTRHRQSDFEQLRASLRQELGGLVNHSPPSPQQRDPPS